MFRKILKWTGLVVLFLVAAVSILTLTRQHLTYSAPYPQISASTDSTVIAQGRELVLLKRGCANCHSPIDNLDSVMNLGQTPALAGARPFETPFGKFFSPNITQDPVTGIGRMTDGELARLFRYGVKANGEAALPFMQGQDMSDADMTAVISYLRTLKPITNPVPPHEFNLVGRFAKAFVVKPTIPQAAIIP